MIIAIVVMIVGYIGVFFGRLIQSAISRQREFLADAAAVQFTRNPSGIANALRKIQRYATGSRIENPDAMEAGHLFFSNALTNSFANVFSTHPPLEKRIAAIDPTGITKKVLKDKPPTAPPRAKRSPHGHPNEFVSHFGSIDDASISRAHSAIDSLPAELSQLARNPLTASTLLLASIGLDPAQRAYRDLSPVQQHSLFEISLASIKDLPLRERESKLSEIQKLAQKDGVIDFDEQCLLIAMEKSIQSFHTNSKFGHRPFPQTRTAIEIVLSAIALSGSDDEAQAQTAFDRGSTAFNAFGTQLQARFDHAREPNSLNEAITATSESIMAVRKTTLIAATKIITHDEKLGERELQHIRSLCAALECPAPILTES